MLPDNLQTNPKIIRHTQTLTVKTTRRRPPPFLWLSFHGTWRRDCNTIIHSLIRCYPLLCDISNSRVELNTEYINGYTYDRFQDSNTLLCPSSPWQSSSMPACLGFIFTSSDTDQEEKGREEVTYTLPTCGGEGRVMARPLEHSYPVVAWRGRKKDIIIIICRLRLRYQVDQST